jgi:hypothetical protein
MLRRGMRTGIALARPLGTGVELYGVVRERRLAVQDVVEARGVREDERRALPPPRRFGWTPADAVEAYRSTLAGELPAPSFDVLA